MNRLMAASFVCIVQQLWVTPIIHKISLYGLLFTHLLLRSHTSGSGPGIGAKLLLNVTPPPVFSFEPLAASVVFTVEFLQVEMSIWQHAVLLPWLAWLPSKHGMGWAILHRWDTQVFATGCLLNRVDRLIGGCRFYCIATLHGMAYLGRH